ncbi:hypothetical protein GQ55_5G091200 [Panicum hallii var. hallii]|uniref:Uncharacterized protein n=2 Tax=Panicum hallii TaxID=206008 RepID=A0A2T7DEE4_9POAL|nr:hypothetical protein GQ55_5G091200 [Panicum hallii var. hallii]
MYAMGAFFFRVTRERFKVHTPKKRKKTKVRRQQPTIRRPVDPYPYRGWEWPQVVGLAAREA